MRISATVLLVNAFATAALGGDFRDRVVDKAEIVATRPPHGDHRYPLELESLVPIEHSSLVVSTHRGRERADEVVIWAKVADGYRRLQKFEADPGLGSYAPVASFRYGGQLFVVVSFVFSGTAHASDDTVFAVEAYEGTLPTLTKVQIQSPIEWFRPKLGAEESVQNGFAPAFSNERLEWRFAIWNRDDPHCCPTATQVRGAFDVCMEKHHDETTDRWTSTWRMFVRDGKREPVGAATSAAFGRILETCLSNEVTAAGLLPDASGGLPHDPR